MILKRARGASRCRSTATGANVRDWLYRRRPRPRAAAVFERGRAGRDLQRRRRQRAARTSTSSSAICALARRAAPARRRQALRASRSPSSPTAPGHDRRYAIDAAKIARRARLAAARRPSRPASRKTVALVPGEPGLVRATFIAERVRAASGSASRSAVPAQRQPHSERHHPRRRLGHAAVSR